jgi:hypothetical protein
MAAALWAGSALFGARRTVFRPSFWSNALITSLILLGPAIEDSASGKSVLKGAAMRTSLFVGVALYAGPRSGRSSAGASNGRAVDVDAIEENP